MVVTMLTLLDLAVGDESQGEIVDGDGDEDVADTKKGENGGSE